MFAGNWLINLSLAVIAFILTFIGSFFTNLVTTSLIRGAIAFIVFFLLAYLFRFLWGLALKNNLTENTIENMDETEGTDIKQKKNNDSYDEFEKRTVDKMNLTDDEIVRASEYVKDLMDDDKEV
ncbi:hypothetical protein [Bacillus sp. FJAT-45350]|uniref:hypothetical protein n=1 Tax=Bacillus sp. FJAT-45350 TaxID=2011014 RepID=UPI000BB760BE|nr:hypothetical protein [Bacillus sp. FJAT-45350]